MWLPHFVITWKRAAVAAWISKQEGLWWFNVMYNYCNYRALFLKFISFFAGNCSLLWCLCIVLPRIHLSVKRCGSETSCSSAWKLDWLCWCWGQLFVFCSCTCRAKHSDRVRGFSQICSNLAVSCVSRQSFYNKCQITSTLHEYEVDGIGVTTVWDIVSTFVSVTQLAILNAMSHNETWYLWQDLGRCRGLSWWHSW